MMFQSQSYCLLALLIFINLPYSFAENIVQKSDRFRDLTDLLPPPDNAHLASGAPGPDYWQQQVDYVIDVTLNENEHSITGSEIITYHNNSPHALRYLWVQLDNNLFSPKSDAHLTSISNINTADKLKATELAAIIHRDQFAGGLNITNVSTPDGQPLKQTIVDTMLSVDLPQELKPGEKFSFKISWNYIINNSAFIGGRTGYEYFEDDKNSIYELAHWYPRMAAYTTEHGWHLKHYLGAGEFDLEFGNFTVNITAPADHLVPATGVLQNQQEILTPVQIERYNAAKSADKPVLIVTKEEAIAKEGQRVNNTKTWKYKADNVRDFAFASSRKFIWDAQQTDVEGKKIMAMSFYPKEADTLWSRYSTPATIHTLQVYSSFTIPYPYPVAISVNGPVGGMEYPMLAFTAARGEKDGTYSAAQKHAVISVIIHEVGHNFFPMILNSSERYHAWLDEGLNTFCEFQAEQRWQKDFPSRNVQPKDTTVSMLKSPQSPIMSMPDGQLALGYTSYAKVTSGLNILRETILGRERFDKAFKEYARRWQFKRPTPADFFRTMEDVSGTDLDWFFRGWFFSVDHCDQSLEDITRLIPKTGNPKVDKPLDKERNEKSPPTIVELRNENMTRIVDLKPELLDFYNKFDEYAVTEEDLKNYKKYLEELTPEEKELLAKQTNIYQLEIKNQGKLIMPVIMEVMFTDKTTEVIRLPAEIWRHQDAPSIKKLILTPKTISKITLDPYFEIADTNTKNNTFPRPIEEIHIDIYKTKPTDKNEMQKLKKSDKNDTEKNEKEKNE
jgi:hypothetical protein